MKYAADEGDLGGGDDGGKAEAEIDRYVDRPGDRDNYAGDLGVYLDEDRKPSNPFGLSLGADEQIAKLDDIKRDLDRYSPNDYYREQTYRSQLDIPLNDELGAAAESVTPSGNRKAEPVDFSNVVQIGSYGVRGSGGDSGYSIGLQVGIGMKCGPLKFDVYSGFDVNVTQPEKSDVVVGFEIPYVGAFEATISYEETRDGVRNYLERSYTEAVKRLAIPDNAGLDVRNQF